MKRAYYSNNIQDFLIEPDSSILGELTANHSNIILEELQVNAWRKQITILKEQLRGFGGQIYFEFAIPRMGKLVDNIVIINNVAFIDLKNLHEGSHKIRLIPVLVRTNATSVAEQNSQVVTHETSAKSNQYDLAETFKQYLKDYRESINIEYWENLIYKPTPKIV